MAKIQIKNEKTFILEKKINARIILSIYHPNRASALHKTQNKEGAPSHRTFPHLYFPIPTLKLLIKSSLFSSL